MVNAPPRLSKLSAFDGRLPSQHITSHAARVSCISHAATSDEMVLSYLTY